MGAGGKVCSARLGHSGTKIFKVVFRGVPLLLQARNLDI